MKKSSTYYFIALMLLCAALAFLLPSLDRAVIKKAKEAGTFLPGPTEIYSNASLCYWPIAIIAICMFAITVSVSTEIRNERLMHFLTFCFFITLIATALSMLTTMAPLLKMTGIL